MLLGARWFLVRRVSRDATNIRSIKLSYDATKSSINNVVGAQFRHRLVVSKYSQDLSAMRNLVLAASLMLGARAFQIGFLSLISKTLEADELALWAWIDSVFSLVALCADFGLKAIATRDIAHRVGSVSAPGVIPVRGYLAIHGFNAAVLLIVVIVLSAAQAIPNPGMSVTAVTIAASIVGVNVVLVEWWFNGQGRLQRSALARLCVDGSIFLTLLVVLRWIPSLSGVAIAYALGVLVAFAVNASRFFVSTAHIATDSKNWFVRYREVMLGALPIGLGGMVAHFWFRLPTYSIGLAQPGQQAHFWMLMRLFLISTEAVGLIMLFLFPSWVRLWRANPRELVRSVVQCAAVLLGTGMLGLVLTWNFAPTITEIYLGSSEEQSANVLQLMIVSSLGWAVGAPFTTALLARHREMKLLMLTVIAITLCGVLMYPGADSLTPIGAARSFAGSVIVYAIGAVLLFVRETRTLRTEN